MPELPEVETIRRQLEPEVVGSRIASLQILDPRWSRPNPPSELEDAVGGRTIEALRRRGKYLLLDLSGGITLIMHLRMTGNLVLVEPGSNLPYLKARFRFEDHSEEVLFTDARRFGHAEVVPTGSLEEWFAGRVGVEPLSEQFTPEHLAEVAAGRTAPLKSFLLAQQHLAGIGNIYADEALWRARLHPLSPAGSMRAEHVEALRIGILDTLAAGLDNGGASIDDYRDARGEEGAMQDEFLVHRREGEECPRCGEEISRIVVSGRSTYYCPGCQTRLRRRRRKGARRATSRRAAKAPT